MRRHEEGHMSADCIFCKIAGGAIPADVVHRDEQVTAFRDIQPRAPVHILVIPNRHIASLDEAESVEPATLAALFRAAAAVARQAGVAEGGYRVVVNTGPAAGQSVAHLHLHVLGGREMAWPPG
jgi:histidine triad (HIT) family protein